MSRNYFKIVYKNTVVSLHFFDDDSSNGIASSLVEALNFARKLDESNWFEPSRLCVWRSIPVLPQVSAVGDVVKRMLMDQSSDAMES